MCMCIYIYIFIHHIYYMYSTVYLKCKAVCDDYEPIIWAVQVRDLARCHE